jgi:hypothetical protein
MVCILVVVVLISRDIAVLRAWLVCFRFQKDDDRQRRSKERQRKADPVVSPVCQPYTLQLQDTCIRVS